MIQSTSKMSVINKVNRSGSNYFDEIFLRFFERELSDEAYVDTRSGKMYALVHQRMHTINNCPKKYVIVEFFENPKYFICSDCMIGDYHGYDTAEDAKAALDAILANL